MSIPFTQLTGEDAALAGYFRIGHIVLKLPPTDILTNRVSAKERFSVLRGSNDLVKFTGHGRWDVTVRWTAMLDDTATNIADKYAQWEDLRSIVAIFKAAPFVEVENSYVRQNLCEQDASASNSMRMAFGLRQLRITTHPDIVDAFDCSLSMTWFNYYPYSNDFGYLGASGQSADANMSPVFSATNTGYIDTWKAANMDSTIGHVNDNDIPAINWINQTPGTVSFRWREYRTIKYNPLVISGGAAAAASSNTSNSVPPTTSSSSTVAQEATIVAQQVSALLNVPANIIYSQWAFETSNFTNRGATQLNNFAGINVPGGTGQDYQSFSSPQAFGTYYANLIKKRYPGCAGATSCNAYAAALVSGSYHWYTGSEAAYATGMTSYQNLYYNNLAAAQQNPSLPSPSQSSYNSAASQPNLSQSAINQPNASPTAPNSTSTSTSGATPWETLYNNLRPDEQAEITQIIANGWRVDFASNDLIYLYLSHELTLADREHGGFPTSSTTGSPIEMFTRHISILMVNNLAQIPLSSYPYPTYQHVGSPSSQVSLGFVSVGKRSSEEFEPIHTGVSVLGGISAFLDSQYLTYRSNWRRVDSVHRMQAVYVDSQILNMFGIRGLTFDNLSTETIPESSNEVQVELTTTQYENIFESTPPFQINTIESAAAGVTQGIINSGALNGLSTQEQQTVPLLTQFSQGRAQASLPILIPYLQQAGALASDGVSSIVNTPAITPTPQQISDMLSLVIAPMTNNSSSQTPNSTSISPFSVSPFGEVTIADSNLAQLVANNGSQYPSIVQRLQSVQQSAQWTVGDVCLVAALADSQPIIGIDPDVASAILAVNTDTAALLQDQSVGIQATYDAIFNVLSGNNTLFAQQVNTLADSPAFSQQYLAAFDVQGPALSAANNDIYGSHASYRGMGLTKTYAADGSDYTPAYYFNNSNARRIEVFRQELEKVIGGAADVANQVNALQNASEYYVSISDSDFTGLNANIDSLVKMTHLPGLSMNEAFPTFKLFLMEDEAGGLINCFDNFYSYASVTEMEVIRYRDQPDVAVIQITNISNLLMHHLFDDTLMGRYQYGLNKYRNPTPNQPSEGQIGDVIAGKTLAGQPYMVDLSDGFAAGQRKRIPLQYIALQPGSKIQIRMGYSNNPDNLTPVFTGRVTKIDNQNDMLVITAESYLGELCSLPVYDGTPLANREFGREWTRSDAGDVASIVEKMLETDTAKHFGGLKLATSTDNLVTGLTWTQRVGQAVVGTFGVSPTNILSNIGAAMAASYDRKGENILINHIIDYTGNPTQIRNEDVIAVRAFEDESSSILYLRFDYSTKENSTFTTWDLIKDVSRRYPEYNVCCKQYGFPYSADATLLLAHPLDWYFARPPMIGDAETFRTGPQAVGEWLEWWNHAGGQQLWNVMLKNVSIDLGVPQFLMNIATPTDSTSFDAILNQAYQTMLVYTGAPPNSGNTAADVAFTVAAFLTQFLDAALSTITLPFGGGDINAAYKGKILAAAGELVAVRNNWYKYLESKHPTANDRLKPVRRYHFIDQNSIVHNGLQLNEKIYNSIRVGETTINANDNIPSHYRRVLDVTTLMNYPEQNIVGGGRENIRRLVAQSFLRDEVGKMYTGEIVLRGIPQIEPYDCLVILDPATAMAGIVEVDKVIQSFSLEGGFITIVYPRCIVAINESSSAGIGRMFSMVFAKTIFTLNGLNPFDSTSGLSRSWNSQDGILKGVEIGTTAAAIGGTIGLLALAGPPGWVCALLGSALLLGGVLATGWKNEHGNSIQILPITRFGRPYVGGLEGYQITDFFANLVSTFTQWEDDNIYPLISLYRTAIGQSGQPLPLQP